MCILFWVFSDMVISTYRQYDQFLESKYTMVPALIAIAIGIIFFLCSLLSCGLLCFCKKSRCMQITIGALLLPPLPVLLTGIMLSSIYLAQIEAALDKQMMAMICNYNDSQNTLVQQVDHVQTTLHCCGGCSFNDYLASGVVWPQMHKHSVPWSCCHSDNKSAYQCSKGPRVPVAQPMHIFAEGCFAKLCKVLKDNQINISSPLSHSRCSFSCSGAL